MLTPGRHYVNDTVPLTMKYADSSGADVDPAGLTLDVISPSRVQATYTYGTDDELERVDAGDYYCEVIPNESGRWFYRWTSTGIGTSSVREGSFVVMVSAFDDPTNTFSGTAPVYDLEQLT